MNKFLLAASLVAVVVSPALAQSFDPDLGTGNITLPAYAQKAPASVRDAFAMVGTQQRVVYTDPDAFIRLQLRHAAEYGN